MCSDIVISARKLGKRYLIGHTSTNRYETFRDRFASTTAETRRNFVRMLRGEQILSGSEIEEFWALKDVNFDIRRGEVVGVIGRNGAGKSTLLKILSRITEPSEGKVEISGRVASLLEVGTGFHPELTGRENIFLNGAILGMDRAEIRSKFDEIIDFAGIEKFLDTPVKRYSSGMYVRLAFAVAAHLEPEILIVDEVLAVGDAEFQSKCLGKMQDIAQHGRTVLFVSHNIGAINRLCQRGIVLTSGSIEYEGDTASAIQRYFTGTDDNGLQSQTKWDDTILKADPAFRLRSVTVFGEIGKGQTFSPQENIRISIVYDQTEELRNARVVIRFLTLNGEVAFATTDETTRPVVNPPGRYKTECEIPGGILNRREYIVQLNARVLGEKELLPITDVARIAIDGVGNDGSNGGNTSWPGVVCPEIKWVVKQVELGQSPSDTAV